MQLRINPSYKAHIFVALLTSIWLVLFLIIIAPFDASDLPIKYRLILMPFYGVISFLSYLLLLPLQQWFFKTKRAWTMLQEIPFLVVYNLLALFGCYLYYKSGHINGDSNLLGFTFEIYYPIFFVLLSILLFLRWFVFKKSSPDNVQVASSKITLSGTNKLDTLQLNLEELVSVSSADNYVEVNFLKAGVLHKKLLRNTLKTIAQEQPSLIQVHRSHLINPLHFSEWKNASTILVASIEVPVTKTYKNSILALKG